MLLQFKNSEGQVFLGCLGGINNCLFLYCGSTFADVNDIIYYIFSYLMLMISYYINDLLTGLEKLKVSCFIGHAYFDCLAYANDIILLASSLAALYVVLIFCSMFAPVNGILSNLSKSYCIKLRNNMSVVQYDVVLQEASL